MNKTLLSTLLFLSLSLSSFAWNKRGHMIVASIAYDQLSDTRKAMFTELLKQHLYFDEWMEEYKKDVELGRYLFMRAAVWPDDIKGRNLNFPFVNESWHYTDYRVDFSEGHQTKRLSPQADILYALSWAKRIMTEKWSQNSGKTGFRYDNTSKAIAFSWILHLIGDIHQPLHCASLFNEFYPNGDQGGNLICVRKDEKAKTDYSLHAFWDDLEGDSDVSLKTMIKQGEEISATHSQVEYEKLEERSPYEWSYESHRLAIANAYLQNQIGNSQGFTQKDLCPALPKGYEEAAKELADKRIYFAGKRLAAFMLTLKWSD